MLFQYMSIRSSVIFSIRHLAAYVNTQPTNRQSHITRSPINCSLTFKLASHHGRAGACPRRPGCLIGLLFGCKSGRILEIHPLNDCYIAAGASPRPTLAYGIRTQSNSNLSRSFPKKIPGWRAIRGFVMRFYSSFLESAMILAWLPLGTSS